MFLQTIQLDHDSQVDRLLIQPTLVTTFMLIRGIDVPDGFPLQTEAIS